jgi:predicted GIY-YIG superfamily endonuclease
MPRFYYVYVIRSLANGQNYVGLAHDLRGRVTVWSDVSHGEPGYPKSDDYNKLKEMLDKTKPLEYKDSGYSGWLEVK